MKELFENYWWQLLLVAFVSYIVGALNFAILFSRTIKHADIRRVGSGNAGTTNVFRVFGLGMGALTFVCDALKGVSVCIACKYIFKDTGYALEFEYFAGMFAVLGHILPAYHKFRGGKGVATSIGVCFVVQPIMSLCCIIPCLLIVIFVDRVSVMSILLSVFVVVWHWLALFGDIGPACCVFITAMFLCVLFAHRHNIVRIFKGKELKTGVKQKFLNMFKHKKRNTQSEASSQSEGSQLTEQNSSPEA